MYLDEKQEDEKRLALKLQNGHSTLPFRDTPEYSATTMPTKPLTASAPFMAVLMVNKTSAVVFSLFVVVAAGHDEGRSNDGSMPVLLLLARADFD